MNSQTHWSSFVQWINKQQKEFKELTTYINKEFLHKNEETEQCV
jgi:hypothetical protein